VPRDPTTETATLAQVSAGRSGSPRPDNPSRQQPADHAPLASTAAGDQCAFCGAQLAADQRYCLQCGERRGAPRLPLMDTAAGVQPTAPKSAQKKRRSRMSPNATLVAGVGTLLLALGVGVLIGRSGNHTSSNGSSGVQVLKVPASGGTATATPAGKSGKTAVAAAGANKTIKSKKHVQSVAAAVGGSSVEGKPKEKLPPPTVKLGQKGQGAGYTNGKFTGDFFK
jgi:hypothetical protein